MIDRLSLCNEVLAPWGFAEQCAYASRLGYRGLEVAPYTLAEDPSTISDAQAMQWKQTANDHGLEISGLHWLLVAPKGLSISSADAAVRNRTRHVIARLIELCAQLGGSYLVHGSPAQRNAQTGQSHADALARAVHALGPANVVVTGGHREPIVDVFFDGADSEAIAGDRHPDGSAHGSGCTHSSALAAHLALGFTPLQAAHAARAIASAAVRDGLRELGEGPGPVDVFGLRHAARPGAHTGRSAASPLA